MEQCGTFWNRVEENGEPHVVIAPEETVDQKMVFFPRFPPDPISQFPAWDHSSAARRSMEEIVGHFFSERRERDEPRTLLP